MKKIVLAIMVMLTGLTSASAASITAVGHYNELTGGDHELTTNAPSVTSSSVESFLGMSRLDGVEGSAFKDSFQITKGQEFSFDWIFSTAEKVSAGDYFHNDYSFINLKLGGETIFSKKILGQASNGERSSATFKWIATDSGLLRYGVGILDVASSSTENLVLSKAIGSSIVISNINPVPLPAAAWLFLSGLLGLVAVKRKTTC